MIKETYKLIDKEGYLKNRKENKHYIGLLLSEPTFEVDVEESTLEFLPTMYWGFIASKIVIDLDEWKYFEKVEDKPYEFKVGDKVKIRKDSRYYDRGETNPPEVVGTVTHVYSCIDHLPLKVDWPKVGDIIYRPSDLELIVEDDLEIDYIPAKPKEFVTSDGKSFPTLKEAEEHNLTIKVKGFIKKGLDSGDVLAEYVVKNKEGLIELLGGSK